MRTLVLVSGPAASGKSALAAVLAGHLGFPLITKDRVKEALFDALGTGDAAWSARLSDAAYEVMFALSPTLPEAVLEANFRPEHRSRLLGFGAMALEVHCVCPPEERRRRWAARRRHPGHLDGEHPSPPPPAAPGPLGVGTGVLEVDTGGEVDVAAVAAWVRARLPHRDPVA